MTALLLAVQLVANAPQCNQGTTYDMRTCWGKESTAASAELKATYAAVDAVFRNKGLATAPLAASQSAWTNTRDKTCAFEYELYLPGTIAPQLGAECDVRMTHERTQHLAAVLKQKSRPPEEPVASSAAAEFDRISHQYMSRLKKAQAASLSAAQTAWAAYAYEWCALEAGSCLTALTNERIAELKASWIGEPFW
ncbi:MAG TPA: lysozyme inhibitor LprI family protein [Candidatus Cybelea sp.]|nr:lysozyme inhibitor LprI family protein [Candidatus Cybelea sp.]